MDREAAGRRGAGAFESERAPAMFVTNQFASVSEAEETLQELAEVFLQNQSAASAVLDGLGAIGGLRDTARGTDAARAGHEMQGDSASRLPNAEEQYRALMEQIPAVVFMA